MQKAFGFFGGRRLVTVIAGILGVFLAEWGFAPDAAERITEAVMVLAGAFILGESGGDMAARFKGAQ